MTTLLLTAKPHWMRRAALGVALLALTACSALRPATSHPPIVFLLDAQPGQVSAPAPIGAALSLPTLLVNPVQAAAGFDSQRLIYLREDHQLAYFAHSEWANPPARMLGPLLVAAIDGTGAFGSVVLTPASVSGDFRLSTQIIRLQHNFQTHPSRVQFTLRAYLINETTRKVLGWREFSAEAVAATENAQGGVTAANLAVQDVLAQLAQFLATTPRTP
ncbi:membrane integrity-associated transporter subunit PqiC [Rhodoferax sp. 4810]|nr:membrane integrity-associated transporter subunit PqiC [Rhodoferax jenense]